MISPGKLKHLLLQGVYDPRINQGMWLSLATAILLLGFHLSGSDGIAIYAILAVFPALIAGVHKPAPRFSFRLARVDLLFFCCALLVLWLGRSGVPLVIIFFPVIFVLAMFAAYGDQAGKVGTGAMIVAVASLSTPPQSPIWLFPLLIGLGTLWYGFCARCWMIWWGHEVLRDQLGSLFNEMAEYYSLKSKILRHEPSKEELKAVYRQQEKIYSLINQARDYLNRYDANSYSPELVRLKQDFLYAVDVMELLQANQYRLDEVRDFIRRNDLAPQFAGFAAALCNVLKKKSFAVKTRRRISIDLNPELKSFEKAIVSGQQLNPALARSMVIHLQMLIRLLNSQQPAFERPLAPRENHDTIYKTLRPHCTFRSPVFRYALRLSVTVSTGILLTTLLDLDKPYWLILAILMVMQSGYLLTKTLITQRVMGTFAGVLLGLAIIQLPLSAAMLAASAIILGLFSFSMIFHHKTWSILGVTALVVVSYQMIFGRGQEMVFTRLVDTLLGCALAFSSNILLWPQWNGGGIKRLLKETLLAQEDLLVTCIRSLSDRSIGFEQLTRRRLKLYTAQNNLLASYQQMLREPQHTRQYVDSVDRALRHFVAVAAHINALLPMGREITPMPSSFTRHMERLFSEMFSCCDEEAINDARDEQEELKIVYDKFERLKDDDHPPRHDAVILLLDLIYERLNTIFAILDFCRTDRKD